MFTHSPAVTPCSQATTIGASCGFTIGLASVSHSLYAIVRLLQGDCVCVRGKVRVAATLTGHGNFPCRRRRLTPTRSDRTRGSIGILNGSIRCPKMRTSGELISKKRRNRSLPCILATPRPHPRTRGPGISGSIRYDVCTTSRDARMVSHRFLLLELTACLHRTRSWTWTHPTSGTPSMR